MSILKLSKIKQMAYGEFLLVFWYVNIYNKLQVFECLNMYLPQITNCYRIYQSVKIQNISLFEKNVTFTNVWFFNAGSGI